MPTMQTLPTSVWIGVFIFGSLTLLWLGWGAALLFNWLDKRRAIVAVVPIA